MLGQYCKIVLSTPVLRLIRLFAQEKVIDNINKMMKIIYGVKTENRRKRNTEV